jgi:hypothetical protein
MSSDKHFNAGNVFGKVIEVKEDSSVKDKPYLQIKVDVSGSKTGRVTAYVKMWGEDRILEFLDHYKRTKGTSAYWFKGFLDQFKTEKNEFLSSFTVYHWEPKEAEKRAVFILKGSVDVAHGFKGGQRILLKVMREGKAGYAPSEETIEVFAPEDKLLDDVTAGQLIEVKGLLRQENVDDFYGGSEGPIHAYIDHLKVCNG